MTPYDIQRSQILTVWECLTEQEEVLYSDVYQPKNKKILAIKHSKQFKVNQWFKETESVNLKKQNTIHNISYRVNYSFQSFKHQIKTKTVKFALNHYDDKRIVLQNWINTIEYGHYHIKMIKETHSEDIFNN